MADLAVIAGTGMTAFGRHPETSVRSLAEEAVSEALSDAGIAPGVVGMTFFANAAGGILHGQEMIRGQSALRQTGVLGAPLVNVENACASASSAVSLAAMAVSSGAVDVALAVGAEKLSHADRQRSVRAIATAVDLEEHQDVRRELAVQLLGAPSDGLEAGPQRSMFMEIYAELTRAYMRSSGATPEDLAAIAVKSRRNGALNPKAQFRNEVTVEEVLASRLIADPLTLMMCSPIGDGAAALVVCSADYARHLKVEQPVRIAASAMVSGVGSVEDGAVRRAVAKAYESASLGPADIDVIELHDAAATGELMGAEDLGLCAEGDAPKLLRMGDTEIGGRIPINPSGGLLSRGHPIGATGCAQLVELADQLRDRAGDRQVAGARTALAHNAGGHLGDDAAAAVITILTR